MHNCYAFRQYVVNGHSDLCARMVNFLSLGSPRRIYPPTFWSPPPMHCTLSVSSTDGDVCNSGWDSRRCIWPLVGRTVECWRLKVGVRWETVTFHMGDIFFMWAKMVFRVANRSIITMKWIICIRLNEYISVRCNNVHDGQLNGCINMLHEMEVEQAV